MAHEDTLRLDRFCGHEVYRVDDVEVYVPDPDDDGVVFLNLEVRCGKAVEASVPEEERPHREPVLEFWLPMPSLDVSRLCGTSVHVAGAYAGEERAKTDGTIYPSSSRRT